MKFLSPVAARPIFGWRLKRANQCAVRHKPSPGKSGRANRRSWMFIGATISLFALLFRLLPQALQKTESLRDLSLIPAVLMFCLTMAIFNFTEANPRKGFAGFPQRLFTMPVRTWFLVGCPMVCCVVSVVGLYVAWSELVMRPVGFYILALWPAILLAAFVVFYQAILWCLSGFRITRLVVLGFFLTNLVTVGFIPYLPPQLRGTWTEEKLTIMLAALMLAAYGATVVVVGAQRRGGGRGWAWPATLLQLLVDAIPHRTWKLNSPSRALLWLEWRRSGLVLPVAVVFAMLWIMGPVAGINGHGPQETAQMAVWLAMLPLLLAVPVGKGIAKPDFWSLELSLPPFLAARPITSGQIIRAKMKSAAFSTLLAWGLLLAVAPLWIYLNCSTEQLRDMWGMFRNIYSPPAQWAIPILTLLVRHYANLEPNDKQHLAGLLRPTLGLLHRGRHWNCRVTSWPDRSMRVF